MGMFLIAEMSTVFSLDGLIATSSMVAGLGFVIFVHELGHFLVAKACGVKCEKFYVGFDVPIKIGPIKLPASLWKRQWGETEYGIGIIPLGGYVKMLGQDDNPGNAEAEAERTRIRANDDDESETIETDVESAEAKSDDDFITDPRSFTAKNVPQRMAIISAGVIMNLIFAVIFATIAFSPSLGVEYSPAIVGYLVPGSPAWEANIPLGDRCVMLTGRERDDHIRFQKDLMLHVIIESGKGPVELGFIDPKAEDKVKKYTLMPQELGEGKAPFRRRVGMGGQTTPLLDMKEPFAENSAASKASIPFKGGDLLTGMIVDGKQHDFELGHQHNRLLARFYDKEITYLVERKVTGETKDLSQPTTKNLEIKVAPTVVRQVGLVMEMGPVQAVQQGSPAYEKIQPGDFIKTINGEPVDDPLALEAKLLSLADTTVTLEVVRGKKTETIEIESVQPNAFHRYLTPESPLALETLGIACKITNTVAKVLPGSPAQKQGMQAGDKLVSFYFVKADEELSKGKIEERTMLLGDKLNWTSIYGSLQATDDDTKFHLTYRRGTKEKTAEMLAVAKPGHFFPTRGLSSTTKSDTQIADSWGEAFQLGVRETKESVFHVLRFLKMLGTGQISVTNLGGPLTIAHVATSEASHGTSRLLVFLTLLSANLAVVNFLPIPVLDGGHMMFLTYEAVRGKPINEEWANKLSMFGLFFILGLMILVFGLDITRIPQMLGL